MPGWQEIRMAGNSITTGRVGWQQKPGTDGFGGHAEGVHRTVQFDSQPTVTCHSWCNSNNLDHHPCVNHTEAL